MDKEMLCQMRQFALDKAVVVSPPGTPIPAILEVAAEFLAFMMTGEVAKQ